MDIDPVFNSESESHFNEFTYIRTRYERLLKGEESGLTEGYHFAPLASFLTKHDRPELCGLGREKVPGSGEKRCHQLVCSRFCI